MACSCHEECVADDAKIAQCTQKIEECNEQIQKNNEDISTYTEGIQKLEALDEDFSNAIAGLECEYTSLLAAISEKTITAQFENVTQKKQTLSEQQNANQETIQEFQNTITELETANDDLNFQITSLYQQIESAKCATTTTVCTGNCNNY